ncbi:FXR2 [Symbiodinium pilosum]|uniref:FXR2 protein n=1 Tax=Symbiodinium pilosum TaxID=2952 RepID=A0A812VVG9_SYMPI|nr:FXR2 [Symbiodinium pilosum]
MEAAAFVAPSALPVPPTIPAPGLPRHGGAKCQGTPGSYCAVAAAAAVSVAVTRRARRARVVRQALSDNPWDELNKQTRGTGKQRKSEAGAPWFVPGWGDEEDEDDDDEEEELERKKPVEESVYCCWVMPKKKASAILEEWAEEEEASDEQKDILQSLASTEFRDGFTVWGLSHTKEGREPGFYLIPPGDPEILTVMEAVDEEKVDVHHVAVRPSMKGMETKQAFLDWVESLRPKMVVVKRPTELYAFDLGVEEGDGKGIKKGSGPKVSKGL